MRNFYKKMLLSLSLGIVTSISMAKVRQIKDIVTDEVNIPIQGAIVMVEGKNAGSVTDAQGSFKFSYDVDGKLEIVITASMIGYEKVKSTVNTTVDPIAKNFTLRQDQMGLKEMIVTGVVTGMERFLQMN